MPILAEKKDEREKPNKHRRKSNGSTVHEAHSPTNGDVGPHSRTLTPVDGINTVALHSPNDETWIQELFQGTLVSTTKCLNCETVMLDFDRSLSFIVARRSAAKMRIFSISPSTSKRTRRSPPACASSAILRPCPASRSTTVKPAPVNKKPRKGLVRTVEQPDMTSRLSDRMCIKKLPRILALHLKRFKYFEVFKQYKKLSYRVVFPFELRLLNTVCDLRFLPETCP